jgi:membrane protease YdiL (CAAX protease family)
MAARSRESSMSLQHPHRWGPWATLAWGAGGGLILIVSQTAGAMAFLAWTGALRASAPIPVENLNNNGPVLAAAFLLSTPIVLAYLGLAVRLARVPFGDYMALHWPRWRDVLIGIAGLASVLMVAAVGATLSGQQMPQFMTETYRTARDAGMLPLFFFGFAVLAPIQEELLFRGFLYRGLEPGIGPWPTIVLTSAVWAVVHMQYNWFYLGEIFLLGIVFAWLRQRSGSTILTMLLHGGLNLLAVLSAATMAT